MMTRAHPIWSEVAAGKIRMIDLGGAVMNKSWRRKDINKNFDLISRYYWCLLVAFISNRSGLYFYEIIYLLFIYSGSYGIKIILSFRLSEYESVCFLNFLIFQHLTPRAWRDSYFFILDWSWHYGTSLSASLSLLSKYVSKYKYLIPRK